MTTYTVKQTISLNSIQDLFKAYGRGDQFSYEALQEIMGYLEDASEDGVIDLDVIAICCYITELTVTEALEEFDLYICDDAVEGLCEEGLKDYLIVELNEHTWATLLDNGNILYLNF